MTVADLIKSSLRLIGAIATGETPSSAEQADALSSLNDLLESWSNDGLLIHEIKREAFTLSPSQAAYTLGSGGDFDTARPIKILEASVEQVESGQTSELPIKILNFQEWQQIPVKETSSSLPMRLYYEDSYPLGTVNLWPIPSVANKVVLYSLKPLASYSSASDTVSLPPGYARALRYNLALEIAPEYGREVSALVMSTANESKADLMRTNTKPIYMKSDAAGLTSHKTFNWLTGE